MSRVVSGTRGLFRPFFNPLFSTIKVKCELFKIQYQDYSLVLFLLISLCEGECCGLRCSVFSLVHSSRFLHLLRATASLSMHWKLCLPRVPSFTGFGSNLLYHNKMESPDQNIRDSLVLFNILIRFDKYQISSIFYYINFNFNFLKSPTNI